MSEEQPSEPATEPKKKNRGCVSDPKITRECILANIGPMLGNLAAIAEALKVSRQAVSKFIKRHPDIAQIVEEEKERVLDLVERSFIKAAIDGDRTCQIFFLKCQGKHRGWVEQEKQTAAEPARLIVETVVVDKRTEATAQTQSGPERLPA